MKLIIGNKNYSSWSLRPWLLMHSHDLPFAEVNESLQQDGIKARLGKYSGSCKVPVLLDQEMAIWDSLAICEYISEVYLSGKGWPAERSERALARAICAEMHSGFMALRSELPMNCRLSRQLTLSAAAQAEVERIDEIWSEYARENQNGQWYLFGDFTIADCFYAPIALRFKSYGVSLSAKAERYQASILSHPSVGSWVNDALKEVDVVPENEV